MPEMRIVDFLRHDAQAYGVPGAPSIEKILEACVVAANWIDKLESRLAQVERERDAAVMEIETAINSKAGLGCHLCKHNGVYDCFECVWEWRGVCEESTKEEK